MCGVVLPSKLTWASLREWRVPPRASLKSPSCTQADKLRYGCAAATVEVVHPEGEPCLLRLLRPPGERREAGHELMEIYIQVACQRPRTSAARFLGARRRLRGSGTVFVEELKHSINEQVALQSQRLLKLGLVDEPCGQGSRGGAVRRPPCPPTLRPTAGVCCIPSSLPLELITLNSSYSFSTYFGRCVLRVV